MKLKDRVAIVTGAARGIGLACARRFAEEGAKVVLTDIDAGGLAAATQVLAQDGLDVSARALDVSRRADLDFVVDETVERLGRLDIMLNNAGIALTQEFMSVTEADFDRVIGINLRGAFFGLQSAARVMIEGGRPGVIINMSSINSRMANPAVATYAISKGGLNQVTSTAAVALAPHGIRVVGIGPGTIATEMLQMGFLTSKAQEEMILSRTPAGRLGEASEVAAVAAFLASDDASYITGQTIYPDGGRMVLNYVMATPEP
jgi:NAD(P)-dependent dehydrogenase (short-subunit alcohol dehydrogenase family)